MSANVMDLGQGNILKLDLKIHGDGNHAPIGARCNLTVKVKSVVQIWMSDDI